MLRVHSAAYPDNNRRFDFWGDTTCTTSPLQLTRRFSTAVSLPRDERGQEGRDASRVACDARTGAVLGTWTTAASHGWQYMRCLNATTRLHKLRAHAHVHCAVCHKEDIGVVPSLPTRHTLSSRTVLHAQLSAPNYTAFTLQPRQTLTRQPPVPVVS